MVKCFEKHDPIMITPRNVVLRLPGTFRGVCSLMDVAAPDYSPDTPKQSKKVFLNLGVSHSTAKQPQVAR